MTTVPATTPEALDERYGRAKKRRLPWIIGGIFAVIAVVVASWVTVSGSIDNVSVADRGFEVTDATSVTVSFQFSAPRDRPVFCILEALDEEFGVVGWKVIEYSATEQHTRYLDESVPTVARATTGLVNSCWVN